MQAKSYRPLNEYVVDNHGDDHGNGNGNGKGNGHSAKVYGRFMPTDRFEDVEALKPYLFPTQAEVIKKTGIGKTLFIFSAMLLCAGGILSLPLSSSVSDSHSLVVPKLRNDFASPMDGFVQEVFFEEGRQIRKGDLLLTLHSKHLQAELNRSRYNTQIFQQELEREITELKILEIKLQETQKLHTLGSVDLRAAEEAGLHYEAQAQKIASLTLRLDQAKSQVKDIQKEISSGQIFSPFDGKIISEIGVKRNSFVRKGDFLFTVASRQSQLEFMLDEKYFSRIQTGDSANVRFYAFPKERFIGKVMGYKHFAEESKQGRSIKVLIDVMNAPEALQHGMTAKVSIGADRQSLWNQFYYEFLTRE